MPVRTYNPPDSMAPIAYIGAAPYMRDMSPSRAGKDEWGVDTAERLVRGGSPSEWQTYGDALEQGQHHPTMAGFFLQSWRPYEDKTFPGWFLMYKGFKGGTPPDPLPTTVQNEGVTTVSADGLFVEFHGRSIVSAERQIKFVGAQTTYRYIKTSKPEGPIYDTINGEQLITILDSRISVTYDDGSTGIFAGSAPAGLASALTVSPFMFNPGPTFTPIVGTPYYECEEVVSVRFPSS